MERSLVIVGAGVAGLSAGCYGRMNDYRTRIFEMHSRPGGLCTSWTRQRYTFDGCIHWLVGSSPAHPLYRIWQELGAVQGREMVDHDEFHRVEGSDGRALVVYTDVDRLAEHLRQLAPEDGERTAPFCEAIRRFSQGDMRDLARWGAVTVGEFALSLRNPFLREVFPHAFYMPELPMLGLIVTLASMHNRSAGYPIGGSLEFARAIERRYLDLGGEVTYGARVAEILVENDRAVGVRLEDGSECHADVVVSAADGHTTIFELLGGRYVDDEIRGYYETLPRFPSIVQVSLGVARDLSAEPHAISFPLDEPLRIAGEAVDRLDVRHFCYDPTLAPAGHSVLTAFIPSSYDAWKRLSEARESYEAEKESVAAAFATCLDRRFPGLAGQVEVADVATPLTYERYTGNWRGSYEGWLPTPESMRALGPGGMRKTLPGLSSFHMIGQWVELGGGLPPAALSGRGLIEALCQQSGRPFVTSVP